MKKIIKTRETGKHHQLTLSHPVLERVFAARGVCDEKELEYQLKDLLPFTGLLNIEKAVDRIITSIENNEFILIIGDYDTDGSTSTAIAVRALKSLGAKRVDFLVPDRFRYGYGLSPEIVDLAAQQKPDLLITVDNGIVSFEGVNKANDYGIDVIITDHHLAADTLPDAVAVVNPNQPKDHFDSKNLAGCGVIFYVMLAVRAQLRQRHWFEQQGMDEPNLAQYLDLLALGTVADVVPLDRNNRIFVAQGLKRIRKGLCVPGIKALLQIGKRSLNKLVASDLGFAVAPRLNAAGRLDDMRIGIDCLLADDASAAMKLAMSLDQLNLERRELENTMKVQAFAVLDHLHFSQDALPSAICLYDEGWHQGVIGILAGRIKEKWHRPTVIFAKGNDDEIKASARSIPGLHIRDVLEKVHKQYPQLILKFGGHAMAAGLTLREKDFTLFQDVFNSAVNEVVSEDDLTGSIETDGLLMAADMNLRLAQLIKDAGPWGQGFPEPVFWGEFVLLEQRIVGSNHLKMVVSCDDKVVDAIAFGVDLKAWPNHNCRYVKLAYRLDVNEFRQRQSVQFIVDYLEPLTSLHEAGCTERSMSEIS